MPGSARFSPPPASARRSSWVDDRAETLAPPRSFDQFAELRQFLAEWLQSVPAAGDKLLEVSRPRLRGDRVLWPEWLAFRSLAFRWRFRSRFEGENTRFLFFDHRATARDMLDAELEVRLRPAPMDEEPPQPSMAAASVPVAFPSLVI